MNLNFARNLGKKFTDVFDANSEEDQRKRLAAGQQRYYADQKAMQSGRMTGGAPEPKRNKVSKAYDQVNIFDSGRSWKTGKVDKNTARSGVKQQFKDIFDSSSELDKIRRITAGAPANYRDEQKAKGNKRPYESLGAQVFGNSARFLNTAVAARDEVNDTFKLYSADWRNDTKDWAKTNQRIKERQQRQYQPNSGLLGAGTIFNNPEEFNTLGATELTKRVGLNTLGTASEVVPWARVARPVTVGGKVTANTLRYGGKTIPVATKGGNVLNKVSLAERGANGLKARMAVNAGIDIPTSAAESAARQYVQTGKVDSKQVGIDTVTGTVTGQVQPVAFTGINKAVPDSVKNALKKQAKDIPILGESPNIRESRAAVLNADKVLTGVQDGTIKNIRLSTAKKNVKLAEQEFRKAIMDEKRIGMSMKDIDKNPRSNNPDVLEIQNAINKSIKSGDVETAKILNESLETPDRITIAEKPTVTNRNPSGSLDINAVRARRLQSVEEHLNKYPTSTRTPEQTAEFNRLWDLYLATDDIDISAPKSIVESRPVVESQPPKSTIEGKPTVTAKEPEVYYPPAKPVSVLDSEGKLVKLGKIAETFFDNNKGNVKINYRQLDSLGKQVTLQTNALYKAIGSDYPTVARKVQEAADRGVKSLDEVDITPNEAAILRRAQAEMNYIRRRASLGNKEISTGDFGEMYIPRQKDGQYDGNNLFEGFRDTKPGSEFKRTGKLKLDDLDYDATGIGQYVTRYGDTKLYREERIARRMQADNPNASSDAVAEATTKMINVQDKVNNLESTIGLGGLGRRHTLSDGKAVDTAGELSDIGRMLNKEQTILTETPSGLTNGDRINSIETHTGETVGDYIGFNQHRDAKSYASSQTIDAKGDRAVLADAVRQRLDTEYTLPQESIDNIVATVGRIKQDLPDDLVQARVTGLYENAAVQQAMEQLQTINIQNKTLRKDVSDLANQILTKGNIERKTSAKVVSGVLKTTNAMFRKLNVSSAINELSDVGGVLTTYGRKTAIKPDFSLISKFGLGDADPALAPYIKAIESGQSLKSVLSSIDSNTNLYHFVETYKAAVLATTARKFYKNLNGDALTKQILKDYRDLILPVDAFTKTFVDNAPLYTQYMSWSLRNLQKEGRLITGKIDAGVLKDKSIGQRIARDVYVNLPTKTLFWLASNGLKGTAIMTAFGINDYLNVASGDYSGIKDEDKSAYDKTVAQVAGSSTSLGLLNTIIQSIEKEHMSNDENYEGVNPYKDNNLFKQVAALGTPQFVKNATGSPDIQDGKLVFSGGADDLMRDGYSKNAQGDIQYAAPDDPYNKAKAFVFGKSSTANARDYSGRTNLADRVKMGQNDTLPGRVLEAGQSVVDMAKEQLNIKDTNYQYPVSDRYKKQIEAGADVKATIAKSREKQRIDKNYYNTPQGKASKALNSTVWNPDTKKYESDVITPEKWRNVLNDKSETNYNHLKEAAKEGNRDFGDPLDPIYSDKWSKYRREIMTMRSQDTGDDTEMKDIAFSTKPWYKEYHKDYIKYIKANLNREFDDNSNYGPSARVKEYWDLTSKNPGIPENSEKAYPLINKYLTIKNGDEEKGIKGDPDAAKSFYKTYADQLSADFDKQKKEKWEWTNKMRAIEGADPIDWATFQNVTFGYEDDERKVAQELYWKFKDGVGSGGSGGSKKRTVGIHRVSGDAGTSIGSYKVKAKIPSAAKVTAKNIARPKVSLKKSLV